MVRHYFVDRAGLFCAAMDLPIDPGAALSPLLSGGLERPRRTPAFNASVADSYCCAPGHRRLVIACLRSRTGSWCES